jgi:lipooligosaccharide transport system permease protein
MSALEMTGRQLDYWVAVYRRTWRGTAVLSFVQPWLYIGAMGVLLGDYVDDAGSLGGASSYLEFIAPGLLAATAMQVAVGEVMWPVMGAIKWDKTYYSMIATPLRIGDIVAGHLGYVAFRVLLTSAVFTAVLAATGIFASALGALGAFAASVLVGMAFATPVYGFSAGAKTEQGFSLIYRLGLVPLFLFSGAFFPISNLAEPLEWLARATPLWHGVELARMSSLGAWDPSALTHVLYLVGLGALGAWWAVRRLERRLIV